MSWQAKVVMAIGVILSPVEACAVYAACRVEPAWTVAQSVGGGALVGAVTLLLCVLIATCFGGARK